MPLLKLVCETGWVLQIFLDSLLWKCSFEERSATSYFQVRARLLIDSRADAAIGDLQARVVNEGANLVIIEVKSPGELLFREWMDGLWLASPIQIYLDLLTGEGRSKEMAEHFRKERIGF